jgi:hypothetical protein
MIPMVKCPCKKNIVPRGLEEVDEEEDEESTGSYSGTKKGHYGSRPSNSEKRKVMKYGCEDPLCILTSEMTEREYLELEENQNDEP